MTSPTEPGADELRVRSILRQRGVGPDAEPPPTPPGPPPPGFDPEPQAWWSHARPQVEAEVEGSEHDAEEDPDDEPGAAADEPERPRKFEPQPGYWPRPHVSAAVGRTLDRAPAAISPGTRRLLYNATAAGAGWVLGLYHQFAAAIADCGEQSIGGALVLGFTGTALIAHVWDRRTRHWWPGIAWCARIPLATAICALALWAPAAP